MNVPFWAWLAVLAVILVMLAVDLFAHRRAHVIGVREAALWSAVWIAFGVGFGGLVWQIYGAEFGQQYFAGYLIEKSLAVDNVFVWAIIFSYFAVPREYQHRVLFFGVLGALVFRAIFIAGGLGADRQLRLGPVPLRRVPASSRAAGCSRHRNDAPRPCRSPGSLSLFRRRGPIDRVTSTASGSGAARTARWLATPLFAVLVLVEVTDIIFAVDSIPAIFAVTQEPFLVFTANAFAILGLRAMYFLLADLIHRSSTSRSDSRSSWSGSASRCSSKSTSTTSPPHCPCPSSPPSSECPSAQASGPPADRLRKAPAPPAHSPFGTASPTEIAELEPLWRRARRDPKATTAHEPGVSGESDADAHSPQRVSAHEG